MDKNDETGRPRIYVASLADYNSGRLLGRWIDADQSAESIRGEIVAMLKQSKEVVAEDWAIHDYEGFGTLRLGEFEDVDAVANLGLGIREYGTVFAELAAHFGGTSGVEEARRYMEEGYCGEFERVEDYAEEFVQDCYSDALNNLPDFIKCHIDYEGIARDLELGGDILTIEHGGMVYIFHANV